MTYTYRIQEGIWDAVVFLFEWSLLLHTIYLISFPYYWASHCSFTILYFLRCNTLYDCCTSIASLVWLVLCNQNWVARPSLISSRIMLNDAVRSSIEPTNYTSNKKIIKISYTLPKMSNTHSSELPSKLPKFSQWSLDFPYCNSVVAA